MCTEVWIDGDMIETLGQMRAKLGRDAVWLEDVPADFQGSGDEYCLCHIDLDATAALMGRIAEWDEWGCLHFVIPMDARPTA